MDIAKRIKERGMKLEDVASRLTNNRGTIGISQPSMSSLINGNPSYSRLKEIADILGITVSELVADNPASHIEPQQKCPYCGHDLNIKVE